MFAQHTLFGGRSLNKNVIWLIIIINYVEVIDQKGRPPSFAVCVQQQSYFHAICLTQALRELLFLRIRKLLLSPTSSNSSSILWLCFSHCGGKHLKNSSGNCVKLRQCQNTFLGENKLCNPLFKQLSTNHKKSIQLHLCICHETLTWDTQCRKLFSIS